MIKPSLQEVGVYMTSLGGSLELAEKFFYHYEMNGWKVGRNPMKSWKAGVSYWIRTERKNGKSIDENDRGPRMERFFKEFNQPMPGTGKTEDDNS